MQKQARKHQIKELLYGVGNHRQNEKKTQQMGENICNPCI